MCRSIGASVANYIANGGRPPELTAILEKDILNELDEEMRHYRKGKVFLSAIDEYSVMADILQKIIERKYVEWEPASRAEVLKYIKVHIYKQRLPYLA